MRSEGDVFSLSFQDPLPSNDVKISLDTRWDFLQLYGQVEGEVGFHHISHHQLQITTLLLIPSFIYVASCPFGGLSHPLLIVILLTGFDLTDF